MNPEIKAKWIEALQSGEYKQGRDQLRHGDKYCCLGVLCDVVDPENWETDSKEDYRYDGIIQMPPNSILEETQLPITAAWLLAKYNDESKWSFDMIAKYVRDNL